MLKLCLIGLILFVFSVIVVLYVEEMCYVFDELNIWVCSGLGDYYCFVGMVNVGEEVILL